MHRRSLLLVVSGSLAIAGLGVSSCKEKGAKLEKQTTSVSAPKAANQSSSAARLGLAGPNDIGVTPVISTAEGVVVKFLGSQAQDQVAGFDFPGFGVVSIRAAGGALSADTKIWINAHDFGHEALVQSALSAAGAAASLGDSFGPGLTFIAENPQALPTNPNAITVSFGPYQSMGDGSLAATFRRFYVTGRARPVGDTSGTRVDPTTVQSQMPAGIDSGINFSFLGFASLFNFNDTGSSLSGAIGAAGAGLVEAGSGLPSDKQPFVDSGEPIADFFPFGNPSALPTCSNGGTIPPEEPDPNSPSPPSPATPPTTPPAMPPTTPPAMPPTTPPAMPPPTTPPAMPPTTPPAMPPPMPPPMPTPVP